MVVALRIGVCMEMFMRMFILVLTSLYISKEATMVRLLRTSRVATRNRLDSWRGTFGSDPASEPVYSVSPPAAGSRRRKSAQQHIREAAR